MFILMVQYLQLTEKIENGMTLTTALQFHCDIIGKGKIFMLWQKQKRVVNAAVMCFQLNKMLNMCRDTSLVTFSARA